MEKDNQRIYDEWEGMVSQRKKFEKAIFEKFISDFNNEADHLKLNGLEGGNNRLLIEIIEKESLKKGNKLSEEFILDLNKELLKADHSVALHIGCYKKRNTFFKDSDPDLIYRSVPPMQTPEEMEKLVGWYNEASENEEYDGIELASIFHYRFIGIHPFEDGNGRTARFLVNYILRRHEYPMIIFPQVTRNYYLYTLKEIDSQVGLASADRIKVSADHVRIFTEFIEDLVAEQMQNEIDLVKKFENAV